MNTRFAIIAALLGSTVFTASASAATYSSEAAFAAANPVTSSVSFSGLTTDLTPVGSPYVKDGVTFTGTNLTAVDTAFWGSVDSLLDNSFNGFIDFSFASTKAVGFYVAGGYGDSPISISFYNGATLLSSYTPTAGGVLSGFSFFGVDGLGDITRVRLDSAAVPGGFASVGPISFSAGVPEPTTWALMILGFGAVGGAMRRRRSVTAKVRFA